MTKPTIAEILHIAADKHLASKKEQHLALVDTKEKFSCFAAEEAVMRLWKDHMIDSEERDDLINRTLKGLEAMGCPTGSTNAFGDEGKFNAENQQARYAWLKFAAMIAEEQGV